MPNENLTTEDQERAAYMAGDTRTAELLARIAELEAENETLQDQLDNARDGLTLCAYHDEYREFFNNCFDRLAGVYPCPSITSDYDKSIIFDAIDRSEGIE